MSFVTSTSRPYLLTISWNKLLVQVLFSLFLSIQWDQRVLTTRFTGLFRINVNLVLFLYFDIHKNQRNIKNIPIYRSSYIFVLLLH